MTQSKPALPADLIVIQMLWTGAAFVQEGKPYPVDETNEAAVAVAWDLIGKGFLASREEVARQQNPEAAAAAGQAALLALQVETLLTEKGELQTRLETANANLLEVTSQKSAAQTTLSQVQQEAQTLSTQKTDLENQLRVTQASLTQASSDLQTVTSERDSARAVFSEADAAAVAEYREYVGELLPANFPARKPLLGAGYLTVRSLVGVDKATLMQISGIADKSSDAIVAAVAATLPAEPPAQPDGSGQAPAEPAPQGDTQPAGQA